MSKAADKNRIKKFVNTGEVGVLIEEYIDIFDSVCQNPKNEEVHLILETVFNLYIPLIKIMEPKKGEHSSLYKRVAMSLYGYD